jgi:DNA helicase HerA-like ATPase
MVRSIGKSLVSRFHPSSIDYYWFVLNKNFIVNTFDFVTVKNLHNTKTIGIVEDITCEILSTSSVLVSSEAQNAHSTDVTQNNSYVINDAAQQSVIAKVAIIANTGISTKESQSHNTISVNFPVTPGKDVRFSNRKEILFSLGVPKMGTPISAAIIEMSNGLQIPVSIDLTYLAGPDTAHVNVSGISGNRKSSYILFLLQSAYQKLRDLEMHQNKLERSGASVIIFNTKEDDLLRLDQKIELKDIGNQAKRAFEILNLNIEVFDNVTYFLPRGKDGKPNSLYIPKHFKTYSYEFEDIYERLDLLFSSPDQNNVMPVLNHIRESWPLEDSLGKIVSNWTDLSRFLEYPELIIPHKSSLQSFISHIQRFRNSPMFVDKKSKSIYLGGKIKEIKRNDIFVIDIAPLSSLEQQAFVIGDVVRSINEMYSVRYSELEEEKNSHSGMNDRTYNRMTESLAYKLPNYILIFLDEANRFIPKSHHLPKFDSVSEEIMKLVIGGRSRGNILFSAQQFKSATDYRFQENIDLHIFAKLGMSELRAKPYYSMLEENVKKNIARLERGELVMVHPAFRHPLKIWFPPSSYKRK